MGKTVTDAAELAEHMTGSAEVGDSVRRFINARRLINELIILRASSNLTQRELASRMGCDPSKISKMEAGTDGQLRWADIVAYCNALGVKPQVLFDTPGLPAGYRLRQYAEDIGGLAGKLTALLEEQGEGDLAAKTHRFTSDVLFKLLQGSSAKYEMESGRHAQAAEPKKVYEAKRRSKGSAK